MQTHANFDLGPCALRAWQPVCISICWLVILLEFVHILKYSYIAIFILCAFCIECTLTSGSSSAQTQQLATQSSSVPAKVYSSWIFGNGPKVHIRVGCDSCGVMLFIFSSLCLSCLIIEKVFIIYLWTNFILRCIISFRRLGTSIECMLRIRMTFSYLLLHLSSGNLLLALTVSIFVLILIDCSTEMNSLLQNLLLDMPFLLEEQIIFI